MGEDIRVVLIKLADRLHNMRTLGYMPESKAQAHRPGNTGYFCPPGQPPGYLADQVGAGRPGFPLCQPGKIQRNCRTALARAGQTAKTQVHDIIKHLKDILEQEGVEVEITGRPKHIYSIYKKMMEKGRAFETLMDLRGVRLIVPDKQACYAALGIIHTHWRPIPHEFDDYIAAPKDNMYQSLHTAVIYDDGKPLEVQIRTREMHQNAEYGIAAHWRYKEKGGKLE